MPKKKQIIKAWAMVDSLTQEIIQKADGQFCIYRTKNNFLRSGYEDTRIIPCKIILSKLK